MKNRGKNEKYSILKGKKIVFIDDEPVNIEFFDVMLSKLGAAFKGTTDSAAALKMVHDDLPHLLITDLVHPGISGWDMLDELKKDAKTRSIPIIIFSGALNNNQEIEFVLSHGAAAAIPKPFIFTNVLKIIYDVLKITFPVSESGEPDTAVCLDRHDGKPASKEL